MPKLTAQEKKWRAESDARTLMEVEEIKKDKARRGAADTELGKMAERASAAHAMVEGPTERTKDGGDHIA